MYMYTCMYVYVCGVCVYIYLVELEKIGDATRNTQCNLCGPVNKRLLAEEAGVEAKAPKPSRTASVPSPMHGTILHNF